MTTAEMIAGVLAHHAQRLHVAQPGIVESYDPATQRASVQLCIQQRMIVEGGTELLPAPLLPSVPVMFPRGGGAFITWPIAKGDHVLVVFQDGSIDRWTQMGGVVDPIDPRAHALSDAVAIPGFYPYPRALPGTDPEAIVLGAEGVEAKFVALAEKVEAELAKLRAAFNSHTHVVSGAADPVTHAVAGTAAVPAPAPMIGNVAAEKVKAS